MFDRGLISLGDDLQILISWQANDPDGARAFINRSGFAMPPDNMKDRTHPQFLAWHREHCFRH
jgi:putative restriction endonuclease